MSETTIHLPESMTIHKIEEIFSALDLAFITDKNRIKINAVGVENIDTSGLQTLLKFVINAKNSGKEISWESPSEALIQSAKLIGLDKELQL